MSLLAINLDGGMTDAGLSLAPIGAIFTQSGVLKPASFTVSALGSPGMFVEVSGSDDDDIAIIKTDDGSTYYIKNTIAEQVAILSNSSGVTKTDAIVLFVDLAGGDDENAGSPGAAQLIAVRRAGVSTGAPTDGEIDAATSNNPWLRLKEVTVEHGTGEIEGADLSYTAARAYVDGQLLDPLSVTTDKLDDGAATSRKVALTGAAVYANANLQLSGALQNVPNCTVTFTLDVASIVVVTGIFSFNGDATVDANAGDLALGVLDVDGATQTPAAICKFTGASDRKTVMQKWRVPLTAASHTIKLQAINNNLATRGQVDQTHTCMEYEVTAQ
jgi:hypothetical protein